jgi:hypothetical protein
MSPPEGDWLLHAVIGRLEQLAAFRTGQCPPEVVMICFRVETYSSSLPWQPEWAQAGHNTSRLLVVL